MPRGAGCLRIGLPRWSVTAGRLQVGAARRCWRWLIAWSWGWRQELTPGVIPLLPKDVAVMGVSEQAVEKNIDGTLTSVLDYSISLEGPGSYALSTWDLAHGTGHRAYAKMQVNNSWELAAVPYIPAFEKLLQEPTI